MNIQKKKNKLQNLEYFESGNLKFIQINQSFKKEIYNTFTVNVSQFITREPFSSIREVEEYINEKLDRINRGKENIFMILSNDDIFIGKVGLYNLNGIIPILGLWIREDFQGKGLGKQIVRIVLEKIRESGIYEAVHYYVFEDNIASLKIVKDLGGINFQNDTFNKPDGVRNVYKYIIYLYKAIK